VLDRLKPFRPGALRSGGFSGEIRPMQDREKIAAEGDRRKEPDHRKIARSL
jgi:hypothetical protein